MTRSKPTRHKRAGPKRAGPKRAKGRGWVPNQHGAWAMLASPLLIGIITGGPTWVHLPLIAFWFVGYFAFWATSQWLKAGRRERWFPPVRTYALASVALGIVVAAMDFQLTRWAPVFVPPLLIGLWAAASRHERDLSAGLATVAGACGILIVAYDSASPVDARAWLLACVQFLYFGGTIFYVKSAIRERNNRRFLWLSIGFHVVATVIVFLIHPVLGVIFVALTVRAATVPRLSWSPQRIGIIEIAATLAVAVACLILL